MNIKADFEIHKEFQETLNSQNHLEKRKQSVGEPPFPSFKIYYKAMVIKPV